MFIKALLLSLIVQLSLTNDSDKNYYLSSQIHPVVSRLCDPIEGTDSSFIASCLGKIAFEIFFLANVLKLKHALKTLNFSTVYSLLNLIWMMKQNEFYYFLYAWFVIRCFEEWHGFTLSMIAVHCICWITKNVKFSEK